MMTVRPISPNGDYLNQQFPDFWIGRGSLIHQPTRSPDLSCLDDHLWNRIHYLVYTLPSKRENMIARIQNAINNIPQAEVDATVSSMEQLEWMEQFHSKKTIQLF